MTAQPVVDHVPIASSDDSPYTIELADVMLAEMRTRIAGQERHRKIRLFLDMVYTVAEYWPNLTRHQRVMLRRIGIIGPRQYQAVDMSAETIILVLEILGLSLRTQHQLR